MADESLVEALVRFWRMLHHVSAPRQQGDITAQQFWLLRQLRRLGPSRMSDLATALGIGQSSVTAACQRLEAQGLISRSRLESDDRVVQVVLTPAGSERVDAWREHRNEILADLLRDLDADEQRQLLALLNRVLIHAGETAE